MSKKIGGKWKGGDGFDVTGEGRQEQRQKELQEEPLVQKPTNFSAGRSDNPDTQKYYGDAGRGQENVTFPAIYGVDMQERKRQAILRDITKGQLGGAGAGAGLPTKDLIGDRQVMLDDKTVDWLLREQDRMALITKDNYFENSAVASGLMKTPQGLKYLQELYPEYFKKRRKLAKWVANAQLKLFDIRMNGIQNKQEFDFYYMLQSLDAGQKKILGQPVWLLNQLGTDTVDNAPSWQPGIFARPRVPNADQRASFAGMASTGGTGIRADANQGGLFGNSWTNAVGMINGRQGGWY